MTTLQLAKKIQKLYKKVQETRVKSDEAEKFFLECPMSDMEKAEKLFDKTYNDYMVAKENLANLLQETYKIDFGTALHMIHSDKMNEICSKTII